MKTITTNPRIVERIKDIVIDTNHIVRETYQFIRLYFLFLLENDQNLPRIDRSFIKGVFSVVSTPKGGGKPSPHKEVLTAFYAEHYQDIQTIKVTAVNKGILDHEATTIVTAVENHIKGSFFTYINRLVYSMSPQDKIQRKRIRNDIYNGTLTSNDQYHRIISLFSPLVIDGISKREEKPQECLPLLYKISRLIEAYGTKQLTILPLRRSLIPSYVRIDKTGFLEAFRDILKEEKVDLWDGIRENVYDTLKCKINFEFTSIVTDGVGCGVLFQQEDKWVKGSKRKRKFVEQYLEELPSHIQLNGRKRVGIDPNKGNLVYCNDGETILRYTQDERRHATKKTKYKKIRKKKQDSVMIGPCISGEFHTIQGDLKAMSELNSRSCSTVKFKQYLVEKNKFANRFAYEVYEDELFRKLKWNTSINMKRNESRFINRFRETYGSDAVVVIGDWEEYPNKRLRGKEPTKGRSMRDLFRHAGFEVYLLDEFRTSKTCCCCGSENEYNFKTRRNPKPWRKHEYQKVWGLLRCTNECCGRIQNRDFNASSNILAIAEEVIRTGSRPVPFRRDHQTCGPG